MINWQNKLAGLLLCLLFGSFAFTLQVSAETAKVVFDSSTRLKGFTINNGAIKLGVQPEAIKQTARMWLRDKKHFPGAPDYLKPVSPVYFYYSSLNNPNRLIKPLWLTYTFSDQLKYQRHIYFYNKTLQQWLKLDSNITSDQQHVQYSGNFTSTLLAVFDDTRYPIGPIKSAQFKDFGDINAISAIALDRTSGDVLYQKNSNTARSIASLTKLMTAYVVLNNNVDLNKIVTYHDDYDRIGGMLYVHEGETMTLLNLMNAMVVGSANNAAIALVNQAGYKETDFVNLMNEQAKTLGLNNTSFADPSGLEVNNLSTAYEYAQFLRTALTNEQLTEFSTTGYYSFSTINTKQFHDFNNTNPLLRTSALDITGSKTGYIDEALYCLALKAKEGNHEVITVVLGVPNSSARFSESERLLQWALDNYEWVE